MKSVACFAPLSCVLRRPLFFALFALALAPVASRASWHWQNPLPQPYTLRSIAFDQADILAAAGDQGTIITTANGGQTWTVRPTGIPLEGNLSRIRYLSPSTLVGVGGVIQSLGVGDGFIVRSADGGVTWTTTATLPNIPVADVEFLDDDHGTAVGIDFATFAPTILTTVDGGETWTTQELSGRFALLNAVHFVDAATGYTVGLDLVAGTGFILQTTDGGATWNQQAVPSVPQLNDITFTDASTGFAIGNGGTILATTDGGASWTAEASGTTLDMHRIVVTGGGSAAIAGGDSADHGVILRTSDSGESWSAKSFDRSIEGIGFFDASTGGAVGADGVIYRTVDGGASWTPQQRSVTSNALQAVAFIDPLSGVAVGTAGTIVRTTDGGNNWLAASSATSLILYGVAMGDASSGVAVGGDITNGDRVILATTDGGASWVDRTPADLPQVPLTAVSCPASAVCTAVGYCGMIIGTTDGGATWTTERAASCADQLTLQAVDFVDADVGTAVGQNTILRTTDGGATWNPQTAPTTAVLRGVRFADPSNGFIVGGHVQNQGTILHTTDGGATWTLQRNDIATNVQAVDATDADHATAVTLDGTIYSTSDAGATWSIEQRVSGNLYGVATVDSQTARAVGAAHGNGAILAKNDAATFSITLDPLDAAVCAPESATSATTVGVAIGSIDQYLGKVALSSSGEPPGITSTFVPPTVAVPGTSQWMLTATPGVEPGRYVVTATGEDGEQSQHADLRLDVIDPTLAPAPVAPANGATDVVRTPTFAWDADSLVSTFRIEVAADAAFADVVIDANVTGTTFVVTSALDPATTYFWRVQGTSGCAGAWSATFSFTTRAEPVAQLSPSSFAFEVTAGVGGTDGATLDIANQGIGDLVWSMDAAPLRPAGASAHAPATLRIAGRDGNGAADLATRLGAPLAGLAPSLRGTEGIDCNGATGLIAHDDGSVENGYSGNPGGNSEVMFVDRFDPTAYPASVDGVCIAMISTGPDALDFDIVFYDDDGPGDGPGTELGEQHVHADGLPSPQTDPVFFGFDVSSLGLSIDSGSMYIGMRWAPADPGVYIASDESPGHPVGYAEGYWWNDVDAAWSPLPNAFPNYRALFVRAVVPTGCENPSAVPWLSVHPASGMTPVGSVSDAQVTVNAAGLPVGDYSANLCFRSNDETRPVIAVPVTMTVLPGGAADVIALGGSGQSTVVGTPFSVPLSVQVRDGAGNPVPDVTVNFTVPGEGASAILSATSVDTDANGYAAVTATANGTAGSYVVTASVDGVAVPASFALANTAAAGDLTVSIVADRTFVQAGQTIDYIVTVGNAGPDAIHGASIATSMSSMLDVAAATWFCADPVGVCTPSGSGDVVDSDLDLEPGMSLTYVLTAPVRVDADGAIETGAEGIAPGDPNVANNSAEASSEVVLFRDGFELYGDGSGLHAIGGIFGSGRPIEFAWPAVASPGVSPIVPVLVARLVGDGTTPGELRVEQLSVGASLWARIVAADERSGETHSAWLPIPEGAAATVALSENPVSADANGAAPRQGTLMLDVDGRKIALRFVSESKSYRIWSSAAATISAMPGGS